MGYYDNLLKQRQTQPDPEAQMMEQYQKALAQREQSIAASRSELESLDSQPQETGLSDVDLKPLMALSDSWFGGNLAASYKSPDTKDKKMFEAQRLKQNLGAQEAGLVDDRLNVARLMSEDRRSQEKSALMRDENSLSRDLKMQMLKDRLAAAADLSKDKNAAKVAGGASKSEQNILKTKESQTIQSQINLKNALDTYEKLVDQYGINITGAAKDKMNSAYGDLKIKYKEAAKLGALTGPDVGIIVDAVAPATGVSGAARLAAAKMGFGGGIEGLKGGIGQIRSNLESDYKTNQSALENAYGANSRVLGDYRNKFYGQPTQEGQPREVKIKIDGQVMSIPEEDLQSAIKDGAELVP